MAQRRAPKLTRTIRIFKNQSTEKPHFCRTSYLFEDDNMFIPPEGEWLDSHTIGYRSSRT